MKPVYSGMKPVYSGMKPVYSGMKPVYSGMKSSVSFQDLAGFNALFLLEILANYHLFFA